jgi:hypothetical protein
MMSSGIARKAQLLQLFDWIELPRLLFEHYRNTIADAISEPVCLADELLFTLPIAKRPLAYRANQNVK